MAPGIAALGDEALEDAPAVGRGERAARDHPTSAANAIGRDARLAGSCSPMRATSSPVTQLASGWTGAPSARHGGLEEVAELGAPRELARRVGVEPSASRRSWRATGSSGSTPPRCRSSPG
jgi:hypothetical protein